MPKDQIAICTEPVKELLSKITLPECKKQIIGFMHYMRRGLLEKGVDENLVREVMANALEDYAPVCNAQNLECVNKVEEAIENFINASDRGQDVLGRILAHYCWRTEGAEIRVPDRGSEQDSHSRQEFVPTLLPLPLADYFLISIRGSVEGVDVIQSLPMLFGTSMEYLECRIEDGLDILDDYRIGGDTREAPIFWDGAFKDKRIMCLARELLLKIKVAMKGLGAERYLRILENLESKHKSHLGERRMERPLGIEDVELIYKVVIMAIKRLEALNLNCAMLG